MRIVLRTKSHIADLGTMATKTGKREVCVAEWVEKGEVCVAEWVDMPRDKPISCSFLRQGAGRKYEVKYTFDVSKCDRLFDILVRGGGE
jgi:hypothetical protein